MTFRSLAVICKRWSASLITGRNGTGRGGFPMFFPETYEMYFTDATLDSLLEPVDKSVPAKVQLDAMLDRLCKRRGIDTDRFVVDKWRISE